MAYLMLVRPEIFRQFVSENEEFFKTMEEKIENVDSITDGSILSWANSEEGHAFLETLDRMHTEVCAGLHCAQYLKITDKFKADIAFKLLMGQIPPSFKQSNRKTVIVRADDHMYVIDRATGEADAYSVSDFIQETLPGYAESILNEYQDIAKNFGYITAYYLLKLDSILCKCLRQNHMNPEHTSLMTFDAHTLLNTMGTLLVLKKGTI